MWDFILPCPGIAWSPDNQAVELPSFRTDTDQVYFGLPAHDLWDSNTPYVWNVMPIAEYEGY